jgi:hypothetical protein
MFERDFGSDGALNGHEKCNNLKSRYNLKSISVLEIPTLETIYHPGVTDKVSRGE